MNRKLEAYRAFHEQAFIPIFVEDGFDSKSLVAGCVEAGMKGIEYTLRRRDAREMIPWIRRNYPDLFLLVGSTLDDEKIVNKMRKRHPQLMTIDEVAELDVDGFVSMLGWREETIEKYAPTHLIAPTVSTVSEALFSVGAGAQFVKLMGNDLDFIKRCRGDAAFDFCPILVTGGMSLERLPQAIEAGAVAAGAGFDLTMKGIDSDASASDVAASVKPYLEAAQRAQRQCWPEIKVGAGTQEWLDSLPHFHSF